jgi:hypothetical protein
MSWLNSTQRGRKSYALETLYGVPGAYSDEDVHEFRPCRPPVGVKRR